MNGGSRKDETNCRKPVRRMRLVITGSWGKESRGRQTVNDWNLVYYSAAVAEKSPTAVAARAQHAGRRARLGNRCVM